MDPTATMSLDESHLPLLASFAQPAIFCLWPGGTTSSLASRIEDEIVSNFRPRLTLGVVFTRAGIHNLLWSIHEMHDAKLRTLHAEQERLAGFGDAAELRIFVVDLDEPGRFIEWRKKLCSTLNMDPALLMSSLPDCHLHVEGECGCPVSLRRNRDSALRFGQLLLHPNTRNFLDRAFIRQHLHFEFNLDRYISWLQRAGMPMEEFCVHNGGPLACHGIREAHDIDFLCASGTAHTGLLGIDSHNHTTQKLKDEAGFPWHPADIVEDPKLHFHYRGVKFSTLKVIHTLKACRARTPAGREKDRRDCRLIESFEADPTAFRRGVKPWHRWPGTLDAVRALLRKRDIP